MRNLIRANFGLFLLENLKTTFGSTLRLYVTVTSSKKSDKLHTWIFHKIWKPSYCAHVWPKNPNKTTFFKTSGSLTFLVRWYSKFVQNIGKISTCSSEVKLRTNGQIDKQSMEDTSENLNFVGPKITLKHWKCSFDRIMTHGKQLLAKN